MRRTFTILILLTLTGCVPHYHPDCKSLALFTTSTIKEYPTRIVTYYPAGGMEGVRHAQGQTLRENEWRWLRINNMVVVEGKAHFEIDESKPVFYWTEERFLNEVIGRGKSKWQTHYIRK